MGAGRPPTRPEQMSGESRRRVRPGTVALLVCALAVLAGAASSAPAPPLGDCTSEIGLAGRSDVIFCEPWESPTWWTNGYLSHPRLVNPIPAREQDVALTSIDTEGCLSGRCLKVTMKQFEPGSLALHWPLKAAGLAPEQLYMRYHLKLGSTFHNENCDLRAGKVVVMDQGGKLPGLSDLRMSDDAGGQCGNGNMTADGLNCWTHRTGFRDCGHTAREPRACRRPGAATRYHGYLYFVGQAAYTGNPAYWDRDPWGQFKGRGGSCSSEPTNLYCGVGPDLGLLARERWYSLEHFIKMNTPGKADGVVRGWVDGVLAYQKTNIVFRIPGHNNLHVRTAWLNVYKGGVYGNCMDSTIWLDQMALATDAPVGPFPGLAAKPQ
jgi:hypothetical protein